MPNIALIHELKQRLPDPAQLQILYIGTRRGMEKDLVKPLGVLYKGIFCGKLRRYFSLANALDFLKIPLGVIQSFFVLRRFKPQAIFCKGGYVCFPVAVAGWLLRIPVILHESDVKPGLANRLSARFAKKICVSFEETRQFFPNNKITVTGNPVRRDLQFGNADDGRTFAAFRENLPVLLVMGGSQGADFINQMVWNHLNHFLKHYQVIHICGENKVREPADLLNLLSDDNKKYLARYRAFAFVGREMKDLYAAADLIICRSGAITLAEIDFFDKPSILIPLSAKVSRGDQIDNANVFAKSHRALVIAEAEFEADKFFRMLDDLLAEDKKLLDQHQMSSQPQRSGAKFFANKKIIQLLLKA